VSCSPAVKSEAKSPPREAPSAAPTGIDQVEAELVRRVNTKDGRGIVALYSERTAKALPEEKTGPFFVQIVDEVGRIVSSEKLPSPDGGRKGFYRLKAERGELSLELHVDGDGKITGLLVTDAPPPPVAKSSIPLALPFRGQWLVFWGGDRAEVNRHVAHASQRRAADLDAVGPDGASYRSDGKKNEDYYAYGQEVLAAADGTVITAIDGVPDNVPGSLNPTSAIGNVVILQHEGSLYSVYGHLQPGEIRVKVGAKVKRGMVLGRCGNSGNSSQPHLHFQLQDGPLLEKSWGVEAVFKDVPLVRQGSRTKATDYTFLKGDLIGEPTKK
jgi:murein DD-endopeptidase MepM/ murein hydrolase activator NlpD